MIAANASGAEPVADATLFAPVLAPGRDVLTLAPGGRYDFMSGSSLSAASISGAVALLLARDRTLTAEQAHRILLRSMRKRPLWNRARPSQASTFASHYRPSSMRPIAAPEELRDDRLVSSSSSLACSTGFCTEVARAMGRTSGDLKARSGWAAMLRFAIICTGVLFPLIGVACESGDRHTCMEQFRALVSYRMEAIEGAFGDFFGVLPEELHIRFVGMKDEDYGKLGREAYDQQKHTLLFPRRALGAKTPNPLRWATYYWPYYQNERHQLEFPVIEQIDNLLWKRIPAGIGQSARPFMAAQGMRLLRRREASALRDADQGRG